MEVQKELLITKIGVNCAKFSFIIGSALFFLYCIGIHSITIIGIFYLMLAIVVNLILLSLLLISLISYRERYLEILKTTAIMLLNIPVAIFYLWLVTELPFSNI